MTVAGVFAAGGVVAVVSSELLQAASRASTNDDGISSRAGRRVIGGSLSFWFRGAGAAWWRASACAPVAR